MIERLFNPQRQETEEHWVSISDVMAGLMVIFLFIAISYMVNANRERDRFKDEAEELKKLQEQVASLIDAYRNSQSALSKELEIEFGDDLLKWTGSLDMDKLSIRYKKPFGQGEAEVPNSFKYVLRDFFPRYIKILTKYKDKIAEIRIEGHTSSEWYHETTEDEAYFNNMELSQNRSRNVLRYVLGIKNSQVSSNKAWIKENMTANGLSSSQPILDSDGDEDKEASRRVEFRVVTKSEKLIDEIKKWMEEFDTEWEVK